MDAQNPSTESPSPATKPPRPPSRQPRRIVTYAILTGAVR